jgi:sigma-B regulation protein RsbU (phosphoserine phosphatase)
MKLRRRLGLIAAVYLFLMVVGGVSALITGSARAEHAAAGRELTVGVQRVGALRTAYLDMETGERGFVITGEPSFLDPYRSGQAVVDQLQERLGVLAHDDARLAADLSDVRSLGQRWLQDVAAPAITARTSAPDERPSEQLAAAGKALFDSLRRDLDSMETRLQTRAVTADRERERAARAMTVLIVLAPLVGIAVTIVSAWLINRWVIHPLDAMMGALRRVWAGELATTVPSLGAPDVAALGRSVDDMRRMISRQLDEAVRDREAVEQNAVLALRLRDELSGDVGQLPEGWSGAASILPAEGVVAGDCYDLTLISPTRIAILVIDIAGHGGAPAVTALKCKEILRAALRNRMQPGRALTHLADEVGELGGSFLTAFVSIIDTVTGELHYANAGHPPALLAHDNSIEELMPTGPLVGPFPGSWSTQVRQIAPGGQLAMYTDGLVEARDRASRAFYGMERLTVAMLSVPCADAQPVLEACLADLHAFTPGRLLDDVTMVVVCRACPEPDASAQPFPAEIAPAEG